ncbi:MULTISPECIES: hypothetical protein [Mycolicibacter]|uniref:Uncharacterized protein n=2 Tax=Mycolicibacter TaxID=1073531 RepID=A0ABU5XQ73_9MYCO|nr:MULTISPECIES: hypothetical protein [unclassified Mycolicibacter]MEB3023477.1 hypothetical protein [Mycolicibacter sp. MYC098]MEB3035102.1 hypothetical protein [Mycolicibacter sp. MYC340]
MLEVDDSGALTNLHLGGGVCARYQAGGLESLVMAGLRECYEVLDEQRNGAAGDVVPDWVNLGSLISSQGQPNLPTAERDAGDKLDGVCR